jgi:serine/threonine-protein kinase HipA
MSLLFAGNNNLSQLEACLSAAHNFLVSENRARAIFEV